MKRGIKLSLIVLTAVLCFGPASSSSLSAEKSEPAAPAAGEKAPGRIPFTGKIHSFDATAKTLTLEGKVRKRVLQLTDKTVILKLGKPARLEDATVGEEAAGLVLKKGDGKEEVVSMRFGPKPNSEPPAKKSRKPVEEK